MTPPTPPACLGAVTGRYGDGLHCSGCAETAGLRQRLATAEAERDAANAEADLFAAANAPALADAAALRERLAEALAMLGLT